VSNASQAKNCTSKIRNADVKKTKPATRKNIFASFQFFVCGMNHGNCVRCNYPIQPNETVTTLIPIAHNSNCTIRLVIHNTCIESYSCYCMQLSGDEKLLEHGICNQLCNATPDVIHPYVVVDNTKPTNNTTTVTTNNNNNNS